jgi:DNA-binding MarR family transcriptional regulator
MSTDDAEPPGTAGTAAHLDEYACALAWSALTAAHARIAERLGVRLADSCGMGITDFQILLRLERVPPPGLRLGELSPAVRLTQPALSRAVARLGRRGWLSRADAPGDRRGRLVAITPAGREMLRRAVPVHAQTIREFLLDPLTPGEQDLLARTLSRVAES